MRTSEHGNSDGFVTLKTGVFLFVVNRFWPVSHAWETTFAPQFQG